MSAPNFIADFDSASAMTRALARFLHGRDFPKLGMAHSLGPLIPVANRLPEWVRDQIYIWSGWSEAIPAKQLSQIDLFDINDYAASEYPERQYKAVAVGSSNGAAVHLLAALGVPWLGQTWLVPVQRSGVHTDEPAQDLEWGEQPGRDLLDANPSWQLHHMHDPNQDRLMVQQMTYFRVKQRELGPHYRRFLQERLEPGGTILIIECQRRWPIITVSDRHYFQPGAMGGATPEEYIEGSERVAEYLRRYGSHRRDWKHGEPDDEQVRVDFYASPGLVVPPDWQCPLRTFRQLHPLWTSTSEFLVDANGVTGPIAIFSNFPRYVVEMYLPYSSGFSSAVMPILPRFSAISIGSRPTIIYPSVSVVCSTPLGR
jgi:hypothetical protein